MTTIKGRADVTLMVPFEYDIDDREFEEWAGKHLRDATTREIQEFMEADREDWEDQAQWPQPILDAMSWYDIWDISIDLLDKP